MKSKLLLSAILIFLLTACVANYDYLYETPDTPASEQSEVKAEAVEKERDIETEAISVYKVVFDLDPDTIIGKQYHSKLRHTEVGKISWDAGLLEMKDKYTKEIVRCLKGNGINVHTPQFSLFQDSAIQKPRYILGGVGDKFEINMYGQSYQQYSIGIEWQLYDAYANKIVYRKYILADSEIKRVSQERGSVLEEVYRKSAEEIAKDQEFLSFIRTGVNEDFMINEAEIIIKLDRDYGINGNTLESMDDILESSIVILSGQSHGSGFLISQEGYALTAAHVVRDFSQVAVTLKNGITLEAKVVRSNPDWDLALLKLPGTGYKYLNLQNDTESLPVGSDIYAVGTPVSRALAHTVSRGTLSSYRESKGYKLIQTDTAVNPGNSGGALLDSQAQAIGVVSSKLLGNVEGIAFGVPSSEVAKRLKVKFF